MSETIKITTEKLKRKDRQISEEKLLDAALELFSTQGFDGTTTKDIAKKAGVNESLIGRYFDGKEGLFITVIDNHIRSISERCLPYPPQDNLISELELYAIDRIKTGKETADFARIVYSHAMIDKKFKKKFYSTASIVYDRNLEERLKRLDEMGKIKANSVEEIRQDIFTFLGGIFFFDRLMREVPEGEMLAKALRFVRLLSKAFAK